jgi:hypothetical protein
MTAGKEERNRPRPHFSLQKSTENLTSKKSEEYPPVVVEEVSSHDPL